MKRRWLLLVILLALAIPVAVYAASVFTRTIPMTGEIVAPPGPGPQMNLQVYRNAGATQEITEVAWGQITAGTQATTTVWVKNTGGLAYITVNITSNLSPAAGSLTANPTGFPLAIGAVREVELTWAVPGGTTPSQVSFNADFVGTTQ